MKKTFKNIRTLAALLMAGAAFAACSSDDSIIENQQPANPSEQVYTLTLEATNGDANTRALGFDGTALKATWAVGDVLYVVKGTTPVGTLSVKAGTISVDGKSATFTGTVAGVSVNDELTLTYHPITSVSDFESQDGTLKGTKGAEKYDMATATVTVKTANASKITINETEASFTTKTAMIKLTLQDNEATPNKLNATSLNVKATFTISTYPAKTDDVLTFTIPTSTYTDTYGGDGILYFALPSAATVAAQLYSKYTNDPYNLPITSEQALAAITGATITFTATVGGKTYTVDKTGYKFAAGKYYKATLTMAEVTALNLTSPAVGQVIGDDGKNYDYASLPGGVTAVAKICYVSGSNGLALALADEGEMNWSTAMTTAAAHTPKFSGGTWKLATKDEWTNMFTAAGSCADLRDGFSSVGGSNMLSDAYWSSTETYLASYAQACDFSNGNWLNRKESYTHRVRSCLAF